MIVGIVVAVVLLLMISAAVMKFSEDTSELRNKIKDQKVEMRTLHMQLDRQDVRITELRHEVEALKVEVKRSKSPTWPPYQPPQPWPKPFIVWSQNSTFRNFKEWK